MPVYAELHKNDTGCRNCGSSGLGGRCASWCPQTPGERDAELIEAGRDWLADCTWADMDAEDFEALTGQQVAIAVNRHYEGGWNAFARSLD